MQTVSPATCTENDIMIMLHTFLERLFDDRELAALYAPLMNNHWDLHLERMYAFWRSAILEENNRSHEHPLRLHFPFAMSVPQINRWVELFESNLEIHCSGPLAEKAKLQVRTFMEMV